MFLAHTAVLSGVSAAELMSFSARWILQEGGLSSLCGLRTF